MKKIILTIMISLPFFLSSQESTIGLSAGYTTNGIGILANYNHSMSQNGYLHFGGYVSFAKDDFKNLEIPYNDLSLNVGYFHNLIGSSDHRLSIAIGVGVLAGYEIINGGDNKLETGAIITADNQFIYGGFAGLNFDYLISDTISLGLTLNEYLHLGSDIGQGVFYAGLGFKYHISNN